MRSLIAAFCVVLSPKSFDRIGANVYHNTNVRLGKHVLSAFDTAITGLGVEHPYAALVGLSHEVFAIAEKL